MIFDLRTGVWRRASGWSDLWGGWHRVRDGWLTYRLYGDQGPWLARLFAMDLVANRLLDASGRVIPAP